MGDTSRSSAVAGRRSGHPGGGRRSPLLPAWAHGYRRAWLRADVLAGLTAGAVVLPQAMGYAGVAGLPAQVGLYTCIVPMLVYALLGGGRRLSMSTTSTIVALTGLALVSAGVGEDPDSAMAAVATLTLMVGAAMLVLALLRVGWVVNAVSNVVITGLKLGVGLTIIVEQLPDLLGLDPGPGGFLRTLGYVVPSLGSAHLATTLIAAATIAVLLATARWAPRIPGPLIVLIGGIVLVALTRVDDRGVELIPPVPRGLPVPHLPGLEHVETFVPFALAIALMAYTETIAVGRSTRGIDDPPLSNDRELAVTGLAATLGSFFSTVPPAGGFSQTMVNAQAGARTQMAGVATAALALAVALFLAPVLGLLPEAVLAGIVVVAVAGLVDLGQLRRIGRIDRGELAVALLTALVALTTNLLVGVLIGVLLTFALLLRRLDHPSIVELRPSPSTGAFGPAQEGDAPLPGLLALRLESLLYTMNVAEVQRELLERAAAADPSPQVLLLDARGASDISVTVMDSFAETDRRLGRLGVTLWLAELSSQTLERVENGSAWTAWREQGRIHDTVEDAVEAYRHGAATPEADPGSTPADPT